MNVLGWALTWRHGQLAVKTFAGDTPDDWTRQKEAWLQMETNVVPLDLPPEFEPKGFAFVPETGLTVAYLMSYRI